MDDKATASSHHANVELSLVRGGPFYRLQRAVGLIRPDRWNVGRRIAVLIAIGWLPLLLITALLNPRGLPSFLTEYRIHARMLIAVPALIFGEVFMESRFRAVLAYLHQSDLLTPPDLKYMDAVIANLARVGDAFLAEFAILVLLIIHTIATYKSVVEASPWLGQGPATDFHLTAAGWYAVVVSASLFQFLLGLGLWKWMLWTFFTFKLSRRTLQLIPTHPDEHGGLGFLGLTASSLAPVTFAATAVIAATWRHEIAFHGAHLMNFKLPFIFLIAIIGIIAVGPLVFFVPRLMALRKAGLSEYGALGQILSTSFHEKWIQHGAGHEAELLTASANSSLNSFRESYASIKQLNPFPADRDSLYLLAAAVAAPALPVVLAQIPVDVVLTELLKALR